MSTTNSLPAATPGTPAASNPLKKIIIGLIVGVFAAFLGLEVMSLVSSQKVEQQRREVGKAGGRCETQRRVPSWLAGLAGEDFHSFMDETIIVGITLTGNRIGDQQLAKVPLLPELRTLDLHDSQVTSEGLKALAPLKTLREVNLENTPVTDVAPLAVLPELKTLKLNFSQVRGAHLSGLAKLPHLTDLYVGYTQVTDEGVVEIAKCGLLESISIAAATLGENGLAPLQSLKNLKSIALKDAKFHPADLEALKAAVPELSIFK